MSTVTRNPGPDRVQRVSAWLRRLPARFPGKLRMARLFLGDRLQARDVELMDCEGNLFVLPHMSEPMALYLLTEGVYEAETRQVILTRLGKRDIMLDVGANVGLFTIPAARRVPEGGVVAVEASPSLCRYLRSNIERNRLFNVHVCQAAASDRAEAAVPFYDAPPEKFGMGSLSIQFTGASTRVPAQTLDALLTPEQMARVTVVKIDVEGFEGAVLRGAVQLLMRAKPPLVILEFMDWAEERAGQLGASQTFLRDRGFRIWRLEDWQRGGPPLETVLTRGNAMLVAEKV